MGAGSGAKALSKAARNEDLGTLARMMYAARCPRTGEKVPRFDTVDFQTAVAEALGAAAVAGAADSIRLLLQCGAPPDGRSQSGATALMQAAAHGHVECIARLLAADADVNATAGPGSLSAFHTACMAGQSDAALTLMHARADASARGGEHIAMTGLEIAKSRGADDPTAVAVGKELRRWSREQADSQLLRAAEVGDLPTLEKMLWTGAWRTLDGGLHQLRDTRISHEAICAAYIAVARQCHSHCLPLLLTSLGRSIERRQSETDQKPVAGAEYRPKGWDLHYPLAPGVSASTTKQISGGVRPGVDILDAEGRTALMLATGGGQPEQDTQGAERRVQCIEFLLEAGAAVNPPRDTFGRTVMHHACIKGHASAAWVLLRAGADVNALLDGQDCIALAASAGYRNMAADLSSQIWREGGGAKGEIELGATDEDDSSSLASSQANSADDTGEDGDENKLLLLDRAKSDPLYTWITSSFAEDTKRQGSVSEVKSSSAISDHHSNVNGLDGSRPTIDLSWSVVIPRPASAKKNAGVPSRPPYAQAAEEASRYGSLPRDGKLAQQLAPRAEAATPALTAAERAMWEVQLHLDAVEKRSMERMRGPPPINLARPEEPDKLVAPAFRRKRQHDDARTIGSLAGWFDLHERTDMLSRKINTSIDKRFGLGEYAESETASSRASQSGHPL